MTPYQEDPKVPTQKYKSQQGTVKCGHTLERDGVPPLLARLDVQRFEILIANRVLAELTVHIGAAIQ